VICDDYVSLDSDINRKRYLWTIAAHGREQWDNG